MGVLKMWEAQWNLIDAGNGWTQTNGILWGKDGTVKFYSGWRRQDSNQRDSWKKGDSEKL